MFFEHNLMMSLLLNVVLKLSRDVLSENNGISCNTTGSVARIGIHEIILKCVDFRMKSYQL